MAEGLSKTWYRSVTPEQLSDDVVVVPSLPHNMAIFIENQRGWDKQRRDISVEYGVMYKLHHSGERMLALPNSHNDNTVLRAPVDGQFLGSVSGYEKPGMDNFLAKYGLENGVRGKDALCFFSPLKGQERDFTLADFYDLPAVVEEVERYLEKPSGLAKLFARGDNQQKDRVRVAFEAFKAKKLLTVHRDDLPPFAKGYEWKPGESQGVLRQVGGEWKFDEPGHN